MIYLDNAATTRMCRRAIEAEADAIGIWGNAHSVNAPGRSARKRLEEARSRIAEYMGADDAANVFLTSGATEGNNWAVKGAAFAWYARKKAPCHIITQKTEHHSVLNVCRWLEDMGLAEVSWLPVDGMGAVNPDDVRGAIRKDTALITVMTVNNETGVRQPVEDIGAAAEGAGVPFHTDATQAFGKDGTDVNRIRCDMLTASGHKFHAGKGCGIFYRRFGARIENLLHGGEQQLGMRPGTDDVCAAARMQAALEWAEALNGGRDIARMTERLTDWAEGFRSVRINGTPCPEAGIVSLSFPGRDSDEILLKLEQTGIICSAGAACTTGAREPSHVLLAMGLDEERLIGTIRVSIGRMNTMEEIGLLIAELEKIAGRKNL